MSELSGIRVLVTDGEQRAALAIVRSLGSAGCNVYVCSAQRFSLAGASKYALRQAIVTNPEHDSDQFVEDLLDQVRSWQIDILIPVAEVSLLPVLRNRIRFNSCQIPFGDYEKFRVASNKARVVEVAAALGFAVPRQERLETAEDRRTLALEALGYPVVVKPARSVAVYRRKTLRFTPSYAMDPDGLRDILDTLSTEAYPLLLQQRIVGDGAGLFVLRWNGDARAVFAHRRIREKPPAGGVSVLRESVAAEPDLLRDSLALLDALDWQGVAMVEVKRDRKSGVPYLMEINPRFWGSLQLAIDAGVDFPRLLVKAARGDDPGHIGPYRVGVRSRWLWGDIDYLLARILHSREDLYLPPSHPGRFRALVEFLSISGPRSRWEVLRMKDPFPFLVESLLWFRGQNM